MYSEFRPNLFRQRSDSISSCASIDDTEKEFQTVIKQLLQEAVFIGYYRERSFVELLNDYRDVIIVSDNESKIIQNLSAVLILLKRIELHYKMKGLFWVGITEPGNENTRNSHTGNYCLYVQLPDTPLGSYWCQIKTVKFRANEILCKVKLLREVATEDLQFNRSSILSKSLSSSYASDLKVESTSPTISDIDWSLYFSNLKQSTNENLYLFFTEWLTVRNTRLVIQFFVSLIISIVTELVHAAPHIGAYWLRFMREFTNLVQVLTPILLGIIDMISKIFGVFYNILIAMLWWRSQGRNEPPYSQIHHVNRSIQ